MAPFQSACPGSVKILNIQVQKMARVLKNK